MQFVKCSVARLRSVRSQYVLYVVKICSRQSSPTNPGKQPRVSIAYVTQKCQICEQGLYDNHIISSSDLLIAQLVERQTSIHEVVGPTRRSTFSNLNIYNSPCTHAYEVFPLPSPEKHTHAHTDT